MRRPLTTEEQTQLEALIDRTDVDIVLGAMAEICRGKADHLASNWQDKAASAVYLRIGGILDNAETAARKLAVR